MIARLSGEIVEKRGAQLVLEVGGVGYLLTCSEGTLSKLPLGTQAKLRVHTSVREDAIDLFGFASEEEETLFQELIRVPGIGPKVAIGILSGGEPREIAQAVVHQDLARIRKLPGVGKKIAERLVVDLRERLAPLATEIGREVESRPAAAEASDELVMALSALGFKPSEAERLAELARSRAPKKAPLEDLVKEALRAR